MLRRAAAQLATRSLAAAEGSICSRAAAGAGASTSSASSTLSSASIFTAARSTAAEWPTSTTTIFRSSSSSSTSQFFGSTRSFAADAAAQTENEEGMASPKSQRVSKVVEEILELNLIEVAELTEILQKRLGVSAMSFAAPMGGGGFGGGGAPAAAGGAPAAAAAAPPAEEKTEFDVKLDAVDGDARLKVIKEVRAATGLGLKEAKEVVERAPTVVKAGVKKEEAAELKAKLEAAGAKVSLE